MVLEKCLDKSGIGGTKIKLLHTDKQPTNRLVISKMRQHQTSHCKKIVACKLEHFDFKGPPIKGPDDCIFLWITKLRNPVTIVSRKFLQRKI
ncbi:hypothetical protein HanRHA438_Chr09g0397071 [Helianthus annuus]|nr:hypothetical protein HanIR_Chr09g0415751 [Helianthus annuus]KAJ0887991.1 hypothetical protein HanRHA438_Chr09g0397071 [Helianthus annuus]